MTLSLPPRCLLFIDGARYADGQPGESDDEPVALDDLVVRWGRDSTLDQPSPATCTFRVLDIPGGQRFLDRLRLGARVDIRADAVLYPDPTVSTIPLLFPSSVVNGAVVSGYGTAAVTMMTASSDAQALQATFPPLPFTSDPSAWDAVPRALAGQAWRLQAKLTFPPAFAGWHGYAARVTPVAYWTPAGLANTMTDYAQEVGPDGVVDISYVPLADSWQGFIVRIWPTGPDWDQLDGTTWEQLSAGAATLTNLCTNPTPGSLDMWASNGTGWALSYANGEILSNRTADSWPDCAVSMFAVGGFDMVTLPAGVKYQRSIEVWVDQWGYIFQPDPGWKCFGATNQQLVANEWNRIVEQFTGDGVPNRLMAIGVILPDVGLGVHVKLRRAQLVANPGGQTVPYFDGSTPDIPGGMTYSWTGTPNASASTAVDQPAATWDSLGTVRLSEVKMLAPAAGASRLGSVFYGRITDMAAKFDEGIGGTVVAVTAQDDIAEYGNRYVGDTPWNAETIGARFGNVVTASGQPINYTIDPGVINTQVSYRDVDNQPTAALLQGLAQSVAGVLWAATSVVTGPFLRLEDVNARAPLYLLQLVGGVVVIVPSPTAPTRAITLDACSLLLEPVEWTQDATDSSTRVALQWKEQTVVDGKVAPTQKTVTALNTAMEAATGQRRVSVSTELLSSTTAQSVAEMLLGRLSAPGWRVDGLVLDLQQEPLDPAMISHVMTILDGATRLGLGIILTNLPEWTPVAPRSEVPLYLEGGRFSNQDGAWRLELQTSSAGAQGAPGVKWSDLPVGWTWNDFSPDVAWSDLAGVGI